MGLIDELKALGVDTDEAIARMNNSASLYKRLILKFPNMMEKSIIQPDFDCNDYNDIIETAHTIKGVSGNLSITPIYKAYSEIVKLLRDKQPEQAKDILEKVIPIQTAIIQCIKKYS